MAFIVAGGVRVQVPGTGTSPGPVVLPDVRALFCPDPSDVQLWRRFVRGETPERALALAVMTQALHDLEQPRHRGRSDNHAARVYAQTREWFLVTDRSWPYSFVSICELFDWSPQAVRARVLRRHPATRLQLVRRRHP